MDTTDTLNAMVHDLRAIGKETGWPALALQETIDHLWKIQEAQRWASLR